MESLFRVILEFIGELLCSLFHGEIHADAPANLRPTQLEALQKRIAPYSRAAAATQWLFYLTCAAVVVLTVPAATLGITPIETALRNFALSMLALTVGIGLLNALLSCILLQWRFTDFHAAVAYRFHLGPGGCTVALILWHLFFTAFAIIAS